MFNTETCNSKFISLVAVCRVKPTFDHQTAKSAKHLQNLKKFLTQSYLATEKSHLMPLRLLPCFSADATLQP